MSVIQPLPSGRRWSANCDAPSARIRSVSEPAGVRAQREVSQRQLARLARPALVLPRLVNGRRSLGEHGRGAAAHYPSASDAAGR